MRVRFENIRYAGKEEDRLWLTVLIKRTITLQIRRTTIRDTFPTSQFITILRVIYSTLKSYDVKLAYSGFSASDLKPDSRCWCVDEHPGIFLQRD